MPTATSPPPPSSHSAPGQVTWSRLAPKLPTSPFPCATLFSQGGFRSPMVTTVQYSGITLKHAFLDSILKALFRDTPLATFRWCARCQVLCLRWHERWASGVSRKRIIKMQFRNTYFRSLVHSSQKLWPKPDKGNFSPCILPCKIIGSQNLMKERYLSKTPFLTFVYL